MAQTLQKTYSSQALQELLTWFEEHMDALPETPLELSKGVLVNNLRTTAKRYVEFVARNKDNKTYGAQVLHLFRMREILMANGQA